MGAEYPSPRKQLLIKQSRHTRMNNRDSRRANIGTADSVRGYVVHAYDIIRVQYQEWVKFTRKASVLHTAADIIQSFRQTLLDVRYHPRAGNHPP